MALGFSAILCFQQKQLLAHNLFGSDESMLFHPQLFSRYTISGISACFPDGGPAFSPTASIETPITGYQ